MISSNKISNEVNEKGESVSNIVIFNQSDAYVNAVLAKNYPIWDDREMKMLYFLSTKTLVFSKIVTLCFLIRIE